MTRTLALITSLALSASACSSKASGPGDGRVAPVYNQETGKLEQLVSDRDGDGRPETRAFMDGAVLKHIEIDRNGDGKPDRWEYYAGGPFAAKGGGFGAPSVERAEEANGADARITRREFFSGGVVQRVEDDTDGDGRTDKWEWYEKGQLARVELDLVGKGFASQRLVYGAGGSVIRIETDPDGDGVFVAVPMRDSGN